MRYYRDGYRPRQSPLVVVLIIFLCIVVAAALAVGGWLIWRNTGAGAAVDWKGALDDFAVRALSDSSALLPEGSAEAFTRAGEDARVYSGGLLDGKLRLYLDGSLDETSLNSLLTAASREENVTCFPTAADVTARAAKIAYGRACYTDGLSLLDSGDYTSAADRFALLDAEDTLYAARLRERIAGLESALGGSIDAFVTEYLVRYRLDELDTALAALIRLMPGATFIAPAQRRSAEYRAFSEENLVPYKDAAEHVFTHCLIAFPDICYSSPSMMASLDTDCITPDELRAILEAVYEKGYILVDINSLFEEQKDEAGNVTGVRRATLWLPKGKKPLIVSVDDVTYDSKKMHTGMVDKLVVGDDGRVESYTVHTDGTVVRSRDNEIFPIIDQFCREHPDFTFRGARGTLCMTGFDGVFGYRTQSEPRGDEHVDRESEIKEAKAVAKALSAEGWTFASHSYSHSYMGSRSADFIAQDFADWNAEVAPIVGPTALYCWPFGDHVRTGDAHRALWDAGVRMFLGVGANPYFASEPDGLGLFMDRKALDGYSLRNRRERYLYLFDTAEVMDEKRPVTVD